MPNDVETFTMGDVTLKAWDAGFQVSPWGLGNVHGARVIVSRAGVVYGPVMFYDSVANADAGKSVNLRQAAGRVAEELTQFAGDPDGFMEIILQDVDSGNFDEKRETIDKLRASETIGSYLIDFADNEDSEWFEKWAESADDDH